MKCPKCPGRRRHAWALVVSRWPFRENWCRHCGTLSIRDNDQPITYVVPSWMKQK